jgi:thiamine-phosphate pyrophosphorylase
MIRLPGVYPILDSIALDRRGIALETAAVAWLEGGAEILQLRHKGHWSREIFDAARSIARLCREAGVTFVVNDRADFAMLLGAGLHVGQDDLPPREARSLIGSEALLGFSSHNAAQLCAAGGEPVDYVALGPIYTTASKENPDPLVGVEEIRQCRPLIEKPLVAIGGITLENAAAVWNAGAESVAVIGGLIPESASARALRERMEEWRALEIVARASRPARAP